MFVLLAIGGEPAVSRQVTLPINATTLRGKQWRSRALWMTKMAETARTWGVRYYAFRYMGQWHLCDQQRSEPIRSIPGEARPGAEMWVFNRERKDRELG